MMSKFKKLMAAALVLCLMLALLPAGVLATGEADAGDASAPEAPVNENADPQGGDNPDPNDGNDDTTTYTVTADPNMEYGTVLFGTADGNEKLSSLTNISASTKVIVYPQAEAGYKLTSLIFKTALADDGVVIEGDSTNGYAFNMPEGDVTVYATFSERSDGHSITIQDSENGTVAVESPAGNTFYAGESVTLAVAPDNRFMVYAYSVVCEQTNEQVKADLYGNKITFTMPNDNVIVDVTFTLIPPLNPEFYSVKCVVPSGHGTVTASEWYKYGDTVELTVTPDEGYELDDLYYINSDWPYPYYDREYLSNPYFTMPNYNVTVVATFKPIDGYEFKINVDTSGNCQVSWPVTAAPGELVKFTIDVDSGYHLLYVKVDGDYVTDSVYWADGKWNYSFYMPWHDVDIYVATTDKLFVNTVYDINGGAVEVWVKDADGWDSTIFADVGDWVCFKATPYSGYEVGDISVTGRWFGNAYDAYYNRYDGCYYFKMPHESVNLSVSFIDNSHKVTVKDVTNGSLTVNTKWAVEDERVYITAVPDKGYELTWLYVKAADGSSVKVYEAIKEDTYYFFMPDQEVTVSAIFAYDYPDMPFIDVNPNSWYYSAIEFVYNKGIMNGVTASSFNPDGTITRGMIVTMLWRMAGEPSAVSAGFADVAADSYYAKAIAWAAKNGIIEGYSASSFGPNDAITREQLATVLYRYAKYLGYTTTGSSLSGYYDASRVSSWAKDAMGWAVKNGVVTGLSSTWLNPNGTASRAEAAQMFMNFYEFLG